MASRQHRFHDGAGVAGGRPGRLRPRRLAVRGICGASARSRSPSTSPISLMLGRARRLHADRKHARHVVPASVAQRKLHQHNWTHGLPLKMRFRRSKLYISAIVPAGVGFAGGFLSGVLGVGGGFLMVPAMIYVLDMPVALVPGTSLFQIIFVAAAVTIQQAVENGTVDIVLALILVFGGVVRRAVRPARRLAAQGRIFPRAARHLGAGGGGEAGRRPDDHAARSLFARNCACHEAIIARDAGSDARWLLCRRARPRNRSRPISRTMSSRSPPGSPAPAWSCSARGEEAGRHRHRGAWSAQPRRGASPPSCAGILDQYRARDIRRRAGFLRDHQQPAARQDRAGTDPAPARDRTSTISIRRFNRRAISARQPRSGVPAAPGAPPGTQRPLCRKRRQDRASSASICSAPPLRFRRMCRSATYSVEVFLFRDGGVVASETVPL